MKYLLIGILFLTGFCFGQLPQNGLVAHYPMDGSAIDASVNGNNGLLSQTNAVSNRFGIPASALEFDGVNSLFQASTPGFFPLTGDFSISFWMFSTGQDRMHIFNLGDYSGGALDNFTLSTNNGSAAYFYWNGPGNNALMWANHSQLTNGKWHHLVFTRASNQLSFYVDKTLMKTATFVGAIGSNLPLIIGDSDFKFKGKMDELAIYNRALSAVEIASVFHEDQPFVLLSPTVYDVYPEQTSCVFSWKADASIPMVDLEYSINNGQSFQVISTAVSIDQSPIWDLNFPKGTSILIRVLNSMNQEVLATCTIAMSEYKWELNTLNTSFSNRDGAGLLHFQNKLWLIGGWDPYRQDWASHGYTCSEIWSSVDGVIWDSVTTAPWNTRHTSAWLVYDDKMWVVGGDPNSGFVSHDVWNSVDGINWNFVADSLQIPLRFMHMSAVLNNKMMVFGGQLFDVFDIGVTQNIVYNDVYTSVDGVNWQQETANAAWSPRAQIEHYAVDSSGYCWILGGGTYLDRRYYNDVWKSSNGSNWQKVMECAPWAGRQYHEVAYFDNKMWVLGGYIGDNDLTIGNGNTNDVWYSEDGINWKELKNTPWPPRHAGSTVVYDNSLWMVAGNLWNDSWRLNNTNNILNVEEESAENVVVYPNPTQGNLHFPNNELGKMYQLFDLQGNLLKSGIIEETVSFANHPEGIYMLKWSNHRMKVVLNE